MKKGGRTKSTPSASYSYKEPLHEKPLFNYAIAIISISALIVGINALNSVNELKNTLTPQKIDIDDFLNKLTSHDSMKGYVGIAPLNVILVSSNNIDDLQSQITNLDSSYIGAFIVQYADVIVVYDYDKDTIMTTVSLQQPEQEQMPEDFFAKLNNHPELQGLENEQPAGGQIDAATLATLQQQFPEVYANTKVGDFLLRYTTKLIIYDYNSDKIVNAVDLG
jgi:hypothetical protein